MAKNGNEPDENDIELQIVDGLSRMVNDLSEKVQFRNSLIFLLITIILFLFWLLYIAFSAAQ